MTWSRDAEEGVESHKIKWDVVPFTRGNVLDLGCSNVSPFKHWTGVDMKAGQHIARKWPDILADCARPMPIFGAGSWDSVFSSHLLEHIEDYKSALREWWRIVRVGGYLVLYIPHRDLYPRMGSEFANPAHLHDFAPDDIFDAMKEIGGFDLVVNQVRDADDEYSFLQVYRKRADGKMMDFTAPPAKKTCAVFRCGAFGDMIQASSVIRGLSDQGYAVTLYTSPRGFAIIKDDPYIARIFIQDEDQVPNHELGSYWAHIAKGYDKFVNLSGTVEEGLLAMEGNPNHRWPHEVRHKMMNVNYLEFQHLVAEIDAPFRPYFYATAEEKAWASMERFKYQGKLIIWSLSGSAVHKSWPHYAEAIERIIAEHADIHIALVGDARCSALASAIVHERVYDKCSTWNIREAMAMCDVADLVFGPETGLLNAAGHMQTPKVVLLSHSSQENLTKRWLNAAALGPVSTPCFPCHILHKSFKYCHEVKPDAQTIQWGKDNKTDVAGPSLCMQNISVKRVVAAINAAINAPKRDVQDQPSVTVYPLSREQYNRSLERSHVVA